MDAEKTFFTDIESEKAYGGDRAPRLEALGEYVLEVVNLGFRTSQKQAKDYFEGVFTVVKSTNEMHPEGSNCVIQIWPTDFSYHKKKLKAMLAALCPGKKITAELAKKIVDEALLDGEKLRVKVSKNSGGYSEPMYSAYVEK